MTASKVRRRKTIIKEVPLVKKGVCYGTLPNSLPEHRRLELAKEAGFDGVELSQTPDPKTIEKLAEMARDCGLEIPSVMCSTNWPTPISSTDEAVRTEGIAGVKAGLEQCKAVGVDVLLVVPGMVTEDVRYSAAYEISQKSLRELVPLAESLGVTMGIENVWNKFLLSPLEMRDFIDEVDSPFVQAYFDVGNMLIWGYPHDWIETLADRIKKVHVKDFDVRSRTFVGLLQGSVDFPRVMNALRGVGYDDYLTMEVSAYPQYPEQFIRDSGAQLEAILKS
jgi:hexulose-6-phosphate isomerase